MMEVEQQSGRLNAATTLTALLDEVGAVTDYRALRDTLPRRLARLLQCRCVILYQRYGDTLQFVAGSFDDKPGWSSTLLAVTHINPISTQSDTLEARAWRLRKAISEPGHSYASYVATPLLYRTRGIGVMVAIRGTQPTFSSPVLLQTDALSIVTHFPHYWNAGDIQTIEAIAQVVAMLLENTRLLERDRERIQELSLLNNISRQFHASLNDRERAQSYIVQYAREISSADLCECIIPGQTSHTLAWLGPALQEYVLDYLHKQSGTKAGPLIAERPGDAQIGPLLAQLDNSIKTFFAIPLWSSHYNVAPATRTPRLLGMIAGGYRGPWKLRREEIVLLTVLANQASSVLENITLMEEVTEARNEARKLLRQVLEEQRQQTLILEEKRRHERLASLGEMAANVAHEVRNPLASIKISMQLLLDDLQDHQDLPAAPLELITAHEVSGLKDEFWEGIREAVTVALKEVERLDALVRDLLQFSRPGQLQRVRCSLAEICDRLVNMLNQQFDEAGITIHRLYRDTSMISVDITQIEQVVLNLFLNALQAMPHGGLLTILIQQVRLFEQALDASAPQQTWLELAVNDTGVGIARDQLERIFQPFFTTKAHGIGLGLPISRRLVEDHQGQLLVESQPGSGSTFIIRLPINEESQQGSLEEGEA